MIDRLMVVSPIFGNPTLCVRCRFALCSLGVRPSRAGNDRNAAGLLGSFINYLPYVELVCFYSLGNSRSSQVPLTMTDEIGGSDRVTSNSAAKCN